MPAKNTDFSTLAEASYEAADKVIEHFSHCHDCNIVMACDTAVSLCGEYHTKRDKTLKALRGRKNGK